MAVQSRPRAIVGGQFERLIAVMKQSLYKSIGNGNLRWHELEEVILDVEITLNNRPLGYVEDYVQMPVLTQCNAVWAAQSVTRGGGRGYRRC